MEVEKGSDVCFANRHGRVKHLEQISRRRGCFKLGSPHNMEATDYSNDM